MPKDVLRFTADNLPDDVFDVLMENSRLGLAVGACLHGMREGVVLSVAYAGRKGTTARLVMPQVVGLTRGHEVFCVGYDSRTGKVRRFAVGRMVDHEVVRLRDGRRLEAKTMNAQSP